MKYFTIEELCHSDTAKRKGFANVPAEEEKRRLMALVETVLDPLREAYGHPIMVNSGYRSPALNRSVGGSATSQHVKGEAADITAGSVAENRKIFDIAKQLIRDGIINTGQLIDEKGYSWIHISLPYSRENQVLHWDGKKYIEEKL